MPPEAAKVRKHILPWSRQEEHSLPTLDFSPGDPCQTRDLQNHRVINVSVHDKVW